MIEIGVLDAIVVAQLNEPGLPLAEQLEQAAVEGVEVEEHHDDVFPPFDGTTFASQLLWLAITFTIFYLLMARVVLPRIGGILEDRRDRIANDLDQADRLKRQSDEAIAGYERALAAARQDAFTIASQARDAAKVEAAKKQAASEAGLNARLAEAEARIAGIKEKALADVGAVASEAAEAVVERLLGSRPSSTEVDAAVTAVRSAGASDV